MRYNLQQIAHLIAANQHRAPTRPLTAFRKLFIQERRDWGRPGAPHIGWKRGELVEFALAPSAEEWGDIGYYVAQMWKPMWWLYAAITPEPIIARAAEKFAARAERKERRKMSNMNCAVCKEEIPSVVGKVECPKCGAKYSTVITVRTEAVVRMANRWSALYDRRFGSGREAQPAPPRS